MKQKILKLAKRLNKFNFDEIQCISQYEVEKLERILGELIDENQIKLAGNLYLYSPLKQSRQKVLALPQKFQYHSKETVDMIIKCFCADIDAEKASKILDPQKACIGTFNRYFREILYKKQEQELLEYFEKEPKQARFREVFDKGLNIYLYADKLFVTDKNLKSKNAIPYIEADRLQIKTLYLRAMRQFNNCAYKKYVTHHVAEQIWRYGKEFEQLKEELFNLLFF